MIIYLLQVSTLCPGRIYLAKFGFQKGILLKQFLLLFEGKSDYLFLIEKLSSFGLIASLKGWANYWSIKQCDQGFPRLKTLNESL